MQAWDMEILCTRVMGKLSTREEEMGTIKVEKPIRTAQQKDQKTTKRKPEEGVEE